MPIVHSGAYGKLLTRIELTLESDATRSNALELDRVALTHLPLTKAQPESAAVLAVLRSNWSSACWQSEWRGVRWQM